MSPPWTPSSEKSNANTFVIKNCNFLSSSYLEKCNSIFHYHWLSLIYNFNGRGKTSLTSLNWYTWNTDKLSCACELNYIVIMMTSLIFFVSWTLACCTSIWTSPFQNLSDESIQRVIFNNIVANLQLSRSALRVETISV